MKSKRIVKAFLLLTAGLVLTLVPFSTGSSNTNPATLATVQRGVPPPVSSVDGLWDFSANMFAGTIQFFQPPGSSNFTGQIAFCAFECTPTGGSPSGISGNIDLFSSSTITFTRVEPSFTQTYTGSLIVTGRPGFQRVVAMLGRFTQSDIPGRVFPWYAVRD